MADVADMTASGWLLLLVNGVLAFTVLEALMLLALYRLGGRGVAPGDYLLNLLSGLCLLLALRAALVGAAWYWPALCLMLSGLLHGTDLWRRWQGKKSAAPKSESESEVPRTPEV